MTIAWTASFTLTPPRESPAPTPQCHWACGSVWMISCSAVERAGSCNFDHRTERLSTNTVCNDNRRESRPVVLHAKRSDTVCYEQEVNSAFPVTLRRKKTPLTVNIKDGDSCSSSEYWHIMTENTSSHRKQKRDADCTQCIYSTLYMQKIALLF